MEQKIAIEDRLSGLLPWLGTLPCSKLTLNTKGMSVEFMPDWLSSERINLIRSMGAEIELVSQELGGFLGSIEMATSLAGCEDCVYLPRQFTNEDNVETHYLSTGPEL